MHPERQRCDSPRDSLYCKEIKGGWKAAHVKREVSRLIAGMAEPPGPGRAEGLRVQHSVCYESSLCAAKILSKITKPGTLDISPSQQGYRSRQRR